MAEDLLPPSLRACAALSKDAERLACYDQAVAILAAGRDTATPPPTPEEMFGMDAHLTRDQKQDAAAKREELRDITARITAVHTLPDGSILIELDNGQAWQQVDEKKSLVIRVGDSVKISRSALDTFRMTTASKRFAKVKRVR